MGKVPPTPTPKARRRHNGEVMDRPGPAPDLQADDPVMAAVARHARDVVSAARRRGDRLAIDDDLTGVDRCLDEGWWSADRRTVETRVGCFVGEVLRRRLDAVWAWDPERGLHLRLDDRRLDPFEWVRGRLAGGPPVAERVRELVDRSDDGVTPAR